MSSTAYQRAVISIHALREEGDRKETARRNLADEFLSTPSARRATALPAGVPASVRHFYPRPPRGGRRAFCCINDAAPRISIHALREEGDSQRLHHLKITG